MVTSSESPTHYAHTVDGFDIAYQVHGDGPADLVIVPGITSHVEHQMQHPAQRRFIERLALSFRVIRFDKRGNGLSDRIPGAPTLEERIDDVRAVLDAVGSSSATLLGESVGGPMCLLFAATYPERTKALILFGTFAKFLAAPDYPYGTTQSTLEWLCNERLEVWGEGIGIDFFAPSWALDHEARRWYGQLERLSATPSNMRALWRLHSEIDVRAVLPTIQAPTLVLHRKDDMVDVRLGEHLAAHIPGAQLVVLPGADHEIAAGNADAVLEAIEAFLTDGRDHSVDDSRALATVLFSDIVDSTARASFLGDRGWTALLDQHDLVIDQSLQEFRGRKVKSTGDGVLALFDGPGRAVRCASAIRHGLRGLGIPTRIGVHAGEVEARWNDVGGLAVHIAKRIESTANTDEVLVSRAVVDLVAGSGIEFEDRGDHDLRGVPGSWRLFSLRSF